MSRGTAPPRAGTTLDVPSTTLRRAHESREAVARVPQYELLEVGALVVPVQLPGIQIISCFFVSARPFARVLS